MNRDSYLAITRSDPQGPTVNAAYFTGPDRTLLYGYTCDREAWHVYLENDTINLVKYRSAGKLSSAASADEWVASELVPDKRVYPESTDVEFALKLRSMGVAVPYRPFMNSRYEAGKDRAFHGFRLSDFPS